MREPIQFFIQDLIAFISCIIIFYTTWFNIDFIDGNEMTSNNTVTSVCEYEAIKDPLHEDISGETIINTTFTSISIPTVLPVSVDDLGEFVLKCHKNENDIFIGQFQVSELLTNSIVALH